MNKQIFTIVVLLLSVTAYSQKAPQPYGVVPSDRILKWYEETDLYGLIHYSPTTYQQKQWGFGEADPAIFNPSNFDANQIAKAAASGGLKGIILVAKHHDGFCLWPTKTTPYNISKSPWKAGKGDMVKEFMLAAKANGLKFGVYLSAWDRNSSEYGKPAYTDIYREQLKELMTGYGELFISWHDGANGGDGYYGGANEKRSIDRATYYEWEEKTWPIVRKYQPMAVIFSDIGPDIRWGGNEKGTLPETSWSTFTPLSLDGLPTSPGQIDRKENQSGTRNGKNWVPAECDFPLRNEWFYNPTHDITVKTPQQLFDIYLASVGRGGGFDVGLSPDLEGRLPNADVQSLAAFGKKLQATFATNLAKGAKVTASNVRGKAYSPSLILDNDRYSYYVSDDNVLSPVITIKLDGKKTFDIVQLRENIKLGQRIDSVQIDIEENGKWIVLAKATSIGANRILKLKKPATAEKLRVQLFAPVAPTLSDFGLYKEAIEKFQFSDDVLNKRTLFVKDEYTVIAPDNLEKAFDTNPATFANLSKGTDLIFELKTPLAGFAFLPRQDAKNDGIPTKYKAFFSEDKENWKLAAEGEFSNIEANPVEQTVFFFLPIKTKYLKFTATETIGNGFTIAEFSLMK